MPTACLLFLALGIAQPATTPIPTGSDKIEIEVRGQAMQVFTYKSANYKAGQGALLVVFHGMLRNADVYRDNARLLADQQAGLVIAPCFDQKRFPNLAYQQGGLFRNGKAQAKDDWTWSLVPRLVDEVRRREGQPRMPYYLVGHSAGGQFLIRMAGFLDTGAARIVAANPGADLFPARGLPYPYGFGNLPEELSNDNALKRYLGQPLTIYVGTADTGIENLDRSGIAYMQGLNRYERGKSCYQFGKRLAEEKGWPFHWRLVEAPAIGHDAKAMFDHANAIDALVSLPD